MMLYHYCDNKKMANIIAGHTLRMSDITKSNDYEEIQLFYSYIMTAIEKEYKINPFSLDYKGEKELAALDGEDYIMKYHHVIPKLKNKIEFKCVAGRKNYYDKSIVQLLLLLLFEYNRLKGI